MGPVKASAAQRRAEREQEKRAHEATMQRQILDWIEVHRPKPGNVLVMTVPAEHFIYPGTPEEEMTEDQKAWMDKSHQTLLSLLTSLNQTGIRIPGAAIIGEGMTLEDLPPPPQPQRPDQPVQRQSGLVLPPGTKI